MKVFVWVTLTVFLGIAAAIPLKEESKVVTEKSKTEEKIVKPKVEEETLKLESERKEDSADRAKKSIKEMPLDLGTSYNLGNQGNYGVQSRAAPVEQYGATNFALPWPQTQNVHQLYAPLSQPALPAMYQQVPQIMMPQNPLNSRMCMCFYPSGVPSTDIMQPNVAGASTTAIVPPPPQPTVQTVYEAPTPVVQAPVAQAEPASRFGLLQSFQQPMVHYAQSPSVLYSEVPSHMYDQVPLQTHEHLMPAPHFVQPAEHYAHPVEQYIEPSMNSRQVYAQGNAQIVSGQPSIRSVKPDWKRSNIRSIKESDLKQEKVQKSSDASAEYL